MPETTGTRNCSAFSLIRTRFTVKKGIAHQNEAVASIPCCERLLDVGNVTSRQRDRRHASGACRRFEWPPVIVKISSNRRIAHESGTLCARSYLFSSSHFPPIEPSTLI